MRILVSRRDSLGDVCEITPVLHRLRLENPSAELAVDTKYPQVFTDSPDGVTTLVHGEYNHTFDLNMGFENLMGREHPVPVYMQTVFGDKHGSTQLRLAVGDRPALNINWSRTIAIHAARSWPNRTLPWSFWRELAGELVYRGWNIIATGTGQDWPMGGKGIIDTCGHLGLKSQLGLLANVRCFVASASGPQIFAQATDVPIVALNTINEPWFAEHHRKGVMGWGFHSFNAPIDCFGCYHKITKPTTYLECWRGNNACVTLFDPEQVADFTEEVIRITEEDERAKITRRGISYGGQHSP